MLIPAIIKKTEIEEGFKRLYYTDEMFYYMGCMYSGPTNISDTSDGNLFEWAIVDENEKVIGYIGYSIDWYSSNASSFGLISFDKNNPLVGIELRNVFNKLINEYKMRRIEWRMVGGNPVERHYDRFCKKYNGNKVVLHNVIKDKKGNFHDDVIYEIFPNKEIYGE